MKRPILTAALSLPAVFATLAQVHAYVNYPWCILGDPMKGRECVFPSREACRMDGRNRGFGDQCIKNPNYDPKKGPVASSGRMLNSLGQPLHDPADDRQTWQRQ
jgi:Protein of unknown function (DUF3551)